MNIAGTSGAGIHPRPIIPAVVDPTPEWLREAEPGIARIEIEICPECRARAVPRVIAGVIDAADVPFRLCARVRLQCTCDRDRVATLERSRNPGGDRSGATRAWACNRRPRALVLQRPAERGRAGLPDLNLPCQIVERPYGGCKSGIRVIRDLLHHIDNQFPGAGSALARSQLLSEIQMLRRCGQEASNESG